MKITWYRSTRNQVRNILAISDFQFLKFLITLPVPLDLFFERVTLTFSSSKVKILPDSNSSHINPLSCAMMKKWLSTYVDLKSGHILWPDRCMSTHAPAHYLISQRQKYRLPFKRIWPVQITTSESCRIRLLLMTLVQHCISDPPKRHPRSHDDVTR